MSTPDMQTAEKINPVITHETSNNSDLELTNNKNDNQFLHSNNTMTVQFTPDDDLELALFVGNLNANVTSSLLRIFFEDHELASDVSRYGEIWTFKKESGDVGLSYVEMSSKEGFNRALTLNGTNFDGNNVIIVPAVSSHRGLLLIHSPISNSCVNDELVGNEVLNEIKIETNRGIIIEDSLHDMKDEVADNAVDIKAAFSIDSGLINAMSFENKEDGTCTSSIEETIVSSIITQEDVDGTVVNVGKDSLSAKDNKQNESGSKDVNMEEHEFNSEDIKVVVLDDCSKVDVDSDIIVEDSVIAENKLIKKFNPINESPDVIVIDEKPTFVALVRNLPMDAKEDELLEFFNFRRDQVVRINFLRSARSRKTSERNLRATISFNSEEYLKKCLAQSNSFFRYKQIYVERYTKNLCKANDDENTINTLISLVCERSSCIANEQETSTSKGKEDSDDRLELDLFVTHLCRSTTNRHLTEFFASAGAVVKQIYRFPDVSQNRGMAFITMADVESVIKGLAMNGKSIFRIKIRVSVRRDRKYLSSPINEEVPPNFSTFIGKLPIKESADNLKDSLKSFLNQSGCLLKYINVPLARNHSGNKGYAFVMFENERSLLICQNFHRVEITLGSCKTVIEVSKHWPETASPTSNPINETRFKSKEREPSEPQEEKSYNGSQNKRKRGSITPVRTKWGNTSKDSSSKPYQLNDSSYFQGQRASDLQYSTKVNYDSKLFSSNKIPVRSSLENDYNSQSQTAQKSNLPYKSSYSFSNPYSTVYSSNSKQDTNVRDYSFYRSREYLDQTYDDVPSSSSSLSAYKWKTNSEYPMNSYGLKDTNMYSSNLRPIGSEKYAFEKLSSKYDSASRYYEGRETSSPLSNSRDGMKRSDDWPISSRVDYHHTGNNVDSYNSVSSMTFEQNSDLPSSRAQNEAPLFSRLERRAYAHGVSESSSYSTKSDYQSYSYPSVSSSRQGEITHYGHHLLSSDRKASFDKSSSFVSKLASSGILSNAGYDNYPGVFDYQSK